MPLAINLRQVSVSCSQILRNPLFKSLMSSCIRESLGAELISAVLFFFTGSKTLFCFPPFLEKASLMEMIDLRSSAVILIGFGK